MADTRTCTGLAAVLMTCAAALAGQEDGDEGTPVQPPPDHLPGAGVPVREIARVAEAPVIDGLLDEAVWVDAPVLDEFYQVEPNE